MMLTESLKLFFLVVVNERIKLRSIDFRAAFLQAKEMEREIFMMPPKYVRKEGMIWKLMKPL